MIGSSIKINVNFIVMEDDVLLLLKPYTSVIGQCFWRELHNSRESRDLLQNLRESQYEGREGDWLHRI